VSDVDLETNNMAMTETEKGSAGTDILCPKLIVSYTNMIGGVVIPEQNRVYRILSKN